MRRLLLISCFLSQLAFAQLQGDSIIIDQVITSQDILKAGIGRLSDLPMLINDWQYSSTDRFSTQLANNLTLYDGQNWVLMINGKRVDIDQFEIKNLNYLPITVEEIDSVVVITTPVFYKAEFADQGLINIITKKRKSGVGVSGHYYLGNEAGDPGPFRYTSSGTGNVEKIGYDYSTRAGGQLGKFNLDFGFSRLRDALANKRTVSRTASYDGYPRILRYGAFGRLKFNNNRGLQVTAEAGYTYMRDYLYWWSTEDELPTNDELNYFLISFSRIKNSGRLINRYEYYHTDNSMIMRPNNFNRQLIFSHASDLFRHEMIDRLKHGTNTLGSDINVLRYSDFKGGFDNVDAIWRIYDHFHFKPFAKLSSNASLYGTLHLRSPGGAGGIRLGLMNRYELRDRTTLWLNLYSGSRLLAENHGIWPIDFNGNESPFTQDEQTSLSSLDFKVREKFNERFKVDAALYARVFSNSIHYQNDVGYFTYDDTTFTFRDRIHFSKKGTVVGGKIGVQHEIGAFSNKLNYSLLIPTAQDDRFTNEWKAMSKHVLGYNFGYHYNERMFLNLYMRYYSASHWLINENTASFNSYQSAHQIVSPRTRIDVSASKYFWEKRLVATLIYRNLLRSDQITNPLGPNLDLRFFVKIQYHFESSK